MGKSERYGAGNFGDWARDGWGLPAYDYTLDERTDPRARNSEINGAPEAWHQVGNDHFIANAFVQGYVQVWSQFRDYQWLNRFDEGARQYAGGFGYLQVDGQVFSTLAADRGNYPVQRRFGVGYTQRRTTFGDFVIDESVYAPYGDSPYVYHDVTIENRSGRAVEPVWWEYWGVNPTAKGGRKPAGGFGEIKFIPRALGSVRYDDSLRMLAVDQLPVEGDSSPISIFATAVEAPVAGFETHVETFFGSGTRQTPHAVAHDKASSRLTDGGGSDRLFAFRSPLHLQPHAKVTLRYAFGFGPAGTLSRLATEARADRNPLQTSQNRWKSWVPDAYFGTAEEWLSRELAWAAYLTRSASNYEDSYGHHVITEGGWYQYGAGMQLAFRDPLQHMLPMVYSHPWLAREVLCYSAREQSSVDGEVPFAIMRLKETAAPLSCDDSLWFLLAITEYVFATRDFSVLDLEVPWADTGSAPLWSHVKMAYRHQESFAQGEHGLYTTAKYGDWADGIVQHAGLTETTMVVAQVAFIYPRLAELARARGDGDFAAQVHARAAVVQGLTRREFVTRGWLSRGYAKDRQLGSGTIYGTPQGWGLLSGALNGEQAGQLINNIRRYLTGIGAPAHLNGPSKIGSSHSPALDDPGVHEEGDGTYDAWELGDNDAVYIPGTWFAINGYLVWGMGSLDGLVPQAADHAWDELKRNTLAAHAEAFPDHWNGTLSIDDYCYSWYSKKPDNRPRCGWPRAQVVGQYGQNTHQPGWLMFNTIKLAGFEPTVEGYTIRPRVPHEQFSLRLQAVGIDVRKDSARGYFRLENNEALQVSFRRPSSWSGRPLSVVVNGAAVTHEQRGDDVVFTLPGAPRGTVRQWAVTANLGAAIAPLPAPPSVV